MLENLHSGNVNGNWMKKEENRDLLMKKYFDNDPKKKREREQQWQSENDGLWYDLFTTYNCCVYWNDVWRLSEVIFMKDRARIKSWAQSLKYFYYSV